MAQSVACTIRRSEAMTPILWIAPMERSCSATAVATRTTFRSLGGSTGLIWTERYDHGRASAGKMCLPEVRDVL